MGLTKLLAVTPLTCVVLCQPWTLLPLNVNVAFNALTPFGKSPATVMVLFVWSIVPLISVVSSGLAACVKLNVSIFSTQAGKKE